MTYATRDDLTRLGFDQGVKADGSPSELGWFRHKGGASFVAMSVETDGSVRIRIPHQDAPVQTVDDLERLVAAWRVNPRFKKYWATV